jgi:hypothetical protein
MELPPEVLVTVLIRLVNKLFVSVLVLFTTFLYLSASLTNLATFSTLALIVKSTLLFKIDSLFKF